MRRCGKSYLLFTFFYNYLKEQGVDDAHIIKRYENLALKFSYRLCSTL